MENVIDEDAVLGRAAAENAIDHKAKPSIVMPAITVGVCLFLIFVAACAEVFSATVAFKAAWPTLSNGDNLAATIMPMRYAIAAYMLLGHIVLRGIADRFGLGIKRLFDALGLIALVLMLVAMACFMFSATYQTTGGSDSQGVLSGLAGQALGALCGSLFTVSFLAAHQAAGKLWKTLPVLADAWSARTRLAEDDQAIAEVNDCRRRIAMRQAILADMEMPDALAERAAVEAAHQVALVTPRVQELRNTRAMYGDAELRDEDDAPLRHVPLAILDQLLADLKTYTSAYFFNLLKKEADHV